MENLVIQGSYFIESTSSRLAVIIRFLDGSRDTWVVLPKLHSFLLPCLAQMHPSQFHNNNELLEALLNIKCGHASDPNLVDKTRPLRVPSGISPHDSIDLHRCYTTMTIPKLSSPSEKDAWI